MIAILQGRSTFIMESGDTVHVLWLNMACILNATLFPIVQYFCPKLYWPGSKVLHYVWIIKSCMSNYNNVLFVNSLPKCLRPGVRVWAELPSGLLLVQRDAEHHPGHWCERGSAVVDGAVSGQCLGRALYLHHPRHRDHWEGRAAQSIWDDVHIYIQLWPITMDEHWKMDK